MKKIYIVCALCVLVLSCKNDAKSSDKDTTVETEAQKDQSQTIAGLFLYLEDENAAVLQVSKNQLFGVVIDDKMKELHEKSKKYKKANHTMVPVVIRGIKKPNPVENAWKEVIEIKEIISVQEPSETDDGTIIIKNNQ